MKRRVRRLTPHRRLSFPGRGSSVRSTSFPQSAHVTLSFQESSARTQNATYGNPTVPDRFFRGREDCFRVSALRDAARRAPWADCRDGTASYAFPALEPEPCSRRDGVQDYARRGEARAQGCEPRDAVPEVRDARHAARAQDDNPHTPETPAAAECSRQKDKDNR